MRVEVEILCAPQPAACIEKALRAAGKQLASQADSVSAEVREGERLTALLRRGSIRGGLARTAQSPCIQVPPLDICRNDRYNRICLTDDRSAAARRNMR